MLAESKSMARVVLFGQTVVFFFKQKTAYEMPKCGVQTCALPIYPALGSVGACRQCAVKQFKDESDEHGKIVMACMTPAAEGTRISLQDPEAVQFRRMIIEGLMLDRKSVV